MTVNMPGQSMIGTIPQGFAAVEDPNDPSGYRMAAIPGGPEDTSAQEAARADAALTTGDVIVKAASRANEAYEGRFAGGIAGRAASLNPSSQNAELYRQVDVLKGNATIESLNQMRQQSPTGGALGNVTEKEGAMLAARAGALDPASPNFKRDLDDYTRTLLRVVHGAEMGDRYFNEQYLPSTSGLVVGAIEDGYRYTGGDPASPSSWERVD